MQNNNIIINILFTQQAPYLQLVSTELNKLINITKYLKGNCL